MQIIPASGRSFYRGFSPLGGDSGGAFDPSAEPTFGAGQTLLVNDGFDSYTTFADAIAGGWLGLNGGTVQDTTANAAGSNKIVAGNGGGKALRLEYYGVDTSDGQEPHSWGRNFSDVRLAKPGHAMYVSYDYRITPGGGFTLDDGSPNAHSTHVVQVKWLEAWTTPISDRAQWSTSGSYSTNGVPYGGSNDGSGTMWAFWGSAGGAGGMPNSAQAGQVSPPFAYAGQSSWHRATHKYVTQSAGGARDGVGMMWNDGSLIVAASAAHVNIDPPNRLTGTQKWCLVADLDDIFVNQAVDHITLGSVMTNATLWPFTIDYDNFIAWMD